MAGAHGVPQGCSLLVPVIVRHKSTLRRINNGPFIGAREAELHKLHPSALYAARGQGLGPDEPVCTEAQRGREGNAGLPEWGSEARICRMLDWLSAHLSSDPCLATDFFCITSVKSLNLSKPEVSICNLRLTVSMQVPIKCRCPDMNRMAQLYNWVKEQRKRHCMFNAGGWGEVALSLSLPLAHACHCTRRKLLMK